MVFALGPSFGGGGVELSHGKGEMVLALGAWSSLHLEGDLFQPAKSKGEELGTFIGYRPLIVPVLLAFLAWKSLQGRSSG